MDPNQQIKPIAEAQRFWMVWREGGSRPRQPHESLESAEREAERVAMKHPGARVFVLKGDRCFQAVQTAPKMAIKNLINGVMVEVAPRTDEYGVTHVG